MAKKVFNEMRTRDAQCPTMHKADLHWKDCPDQKCYLHPTEKNQMCHYIVLLIVIIPLQEWIKENVAEVDIVQYIQGK